MIYLMTGLKTIFGNLLAVDMDKQTGQPIDLQKAEKVGVIPPEPGDMVPKEIKEFEHQENMQNAKLGWVGKIWGARGEKPGNVSAIMALLLVIYLGILIFKFPKSPVFNDVFAGITSIVTLILGYLFGSSDKN